ncbi:FadR/GntR family transcriptional regulator [Geminicoccaceae bacterium 1502E]|nr:FadR/GntR family transcriptional regulator [Geminicoccaceae bacterium 1502E]
MTEIAESGPTGPASPGGAPRAGQRGQVTQTVVREIQNMIRSGALAPGAALPPQRALARELGVSRAALREALSILHTLGMVRVEPARGTFVAAPGSGAPGPASEGIGSWRFSSRYTPQEVYQFRQLAESHAAGLAAIHAEQAQLDRLRENLGAFREAVRGMDLVGSAQCDFEFHQMIMQFSGNRLLADLHRTYHGVLLESQRLPLARRSRLWEPVIEHERILKALEMHDPDGAGYYMRVHLSRAADRVGVRIETLA